MFDGNDPLQDDPNNFNEDEEDMEDELLSNENEGDGNAGEGSLKQSNHRLKAIQDLIEKKRSTGKDQQMKALLSHNFIN